MVTLGEITLPEPVFNAIAARARSNCLTVEQQAARQLAEGVDIAVEATDTLGADEKEARLMAEIDEARTEMAARGVWLTEEILAAAKAERDRR